MNTSKRKFDGSYYNNENFFVFLMDKNTASSGEYAILSIRQMDNALLIGTNSRGCNTGSYETYCLPNSKIIMTLGPAHSILGNQFDMEGVGWMPDIYVDAYLALDRTIKMYKYYGLMPDENVENLECWGESIKRFE